MALNAKHFYKFGPFYLEPSEHLLLQSDRPVPLTPKAFELLVFLVQNQGRLVTKDQIMKAIWPDSFVEEANLTVWISVLRKALGDREGGSRYIETVPKKGYRFTAPLKAATEPPVEDQLLEAQLCSGNITSDVNSSAAAAMPTSLTPVGEAEAVHDGSGPERLLATGAVPGTNRKKIAILLLITLVCLSAAIGYRVYSRVARHTMATPRSLAILPLQNQRQDSDSEFLGFSLADAVITAVDQARPEFSSVLARSRS